MLSDINLNKKMSKIALFSICMVFMTIVMISSCSKDSLDQPGYPGLRCSLGGAEYIADSAVYSTAYHTAIYAYRGNTKISIYLIQNNTIGAKNDSIGIYNLDTIHNVAYYDDGITKYRSISGSVNISQYYNDSLKVITGTFSFLGRVAGSSGNTINITTGYFNSIPKH